MLSSEYSIRVEDLSKRYEIYAQPVDRLKQMTLPRVQRALHRPVCTYFKEFWALRDVSFDVYRGETVGIVGRNGSGKSTLLQMICGTLHPTTGNISVRGRIAALLELGAGFNPEFTGRENVYLNAAVIGLDRNEIDARFDDIAAFADIGEFMERPVKTYSSGMYVRLAFAVAINVDPEILVVDEALAVGDELFQRKCFARIDTIRSQGATILFVSHSANTVIELCDRAVLLDSGQMLALASPKRIIDSYHKLLYSDPQQIEAVRADIRHDISEPHHAHQQEHADSIIADDFGNETYDPGLVPLSTLTLPARGARIIHTELLAESGQPVNGLIRGRRYRFCFNVECNAALFKVRFGCLIKSLSGLPICGTLSHSNLQDGMTLSEGMVASVEFVFDCLLNPGIYFINAGAFGIRKEGEELLHRIVDAVAFRVLPIKENRSTELVDFNCTSLVKVNVADHQ